MAEIMAQRPGPAFVRLQGPLGAGKTAFARGFIAQWLEQQGEAPEAALTSPTFPVARVYGQKRPVAHLDLYRLQSRDDLEQLGFESYFYETPACLVEWLENIPGFETLMPPRAVTIHFELAEASPMERLVHAHGLTDSELQRFTSPA